MSLFVIIAILTTHTVFDWILQTRWQAENKSKNWWALTEHVIIYGVGFALVFQFIFDDFRAGIIWVYLNIILHFITDAITSRLNAKFYPNKSFWNCIGIDQWIHYVTLFSTYKYFTT